MAENGSITLYAKEIFFEEDTEDNTIHVIFRANNMDVRVIQTRKFFFQSQANAEKLGLELAARNGAQVVTLSKRGPMFLRESGEG